MWLAFDDVKTACAVGLIGFPTDVHSVLLLTRQGVQAFLHLRSNDAAWTSDLSANDDALQRFEATEAGEDDALRRVEAFKAYLSTKDTRLQAVGRATG